VQRRHQKVVEEAPAVMITDDLREIVRRSAVELARHVNYVNAGTVEFLVDGDSAYLLEVNTRLQVEHPVTELITGRDLVSLQLLVAQGYELPFRQDELTVSGHAIEARVYAEDPEQGFLPQAGRAGTVQWPPNARVDAALNSGQLISTWYDPMLGKIIVHGATRLAARLRLVDALDQTAIFGIQTNVGFVRRLVASAAFAASDIDTAWLDRTPDPVPPDEPDLPRVAAAWAIASDIAAAGAGPFGTADGWRSAGFTAPIRVLLQHDGGPRELLVDIARGAVLDGNRSYAVRSMGAGSSTLGLALEIDGVNERFFIEICSGRVDVSYQGRWITFSRPVGRAQLAVVSSDGQITAPMPGLVTVVNTVVGKQVRLGDVLGVLEAMKMEHALTSPADGLVAQVAVEPGDQVVVGQPLFTIVADNAAPAGATTG
jgi:3-methylcrotonyl-CoA carboxylase alpha subunit/acetyl-CoA/propionyl-CoA carboxylase biotin carboxyl carrier protein